MCCATASGSIENGFFDGAGNIKSVLAGPMSWVRIQGGTTNQQTLQFYVDTATTGNQTRFAGTETKLFEVSYQQNGVGNGVGVTIGPYTMTWSNGAPNQGAYPLGAIAWNNAPVAGGSMGFMCVTNPCTTPGHWKAMPNLAP
jgi:hypothetical protein